MLIRKEGSNPSRLAAELAASHGHSISMLYVVSQAFEGTRTRISPCIAARSKLILWLTCRYKTVTPYTIRFDFYNQEIISFNSSSDETTLI